MENFTTLESFNNKVIRMHVNSLRRGSYKILYNTIICTMITTNYVCIVANFYILFLFQVPDLAGFWLLTMLQAPLTLYLIANVDTIVLPLERAVNIVLLTFLLVQLFLGFRALHIMVKAQAIKFHLSNFDTLRTNN